MHQNFEGARQLFPKALQEGKLVEYLGGFPGYDLIDPYADSPTDPEAAFEPIRHQIVEDIALRKKVFEALCTLANHPDYGWMAIYYFTSLRLIEKYKKVELVTSELVNGVAMGFRKHKGNWDMRRDWVGKTNKGGLWGAVKGMNKVLTEKYNLTILPEEL